MTKIKVNADLAKRVLTVDEALELLAPHKEGRKLRVHTFVGFAFGIMGCDMDLTGIKKTLKSREIDEIVLAGANMRGMGHGVGFFEDGKGWTFLESDTTKIDAIHKLRRID